MHFKELSRGELVATIGGALLAFSLTLSWFELGNRHATLGSCRGPNVACSGWASLPTLRYLLLLAAVAPAILAWVIIRGHALSWPRGELTAVTALVALAQILFVGVLDKPGMPRGQISLNLGWFVALGGGLLILFGSVFRAKESGAKRKPPGVM
jgi:hypothetical protein